MSKLPQKPALPDQELQYFLDAISSRTRQKLLLAFLDGQARTVGELVDYSGLGQSTVSAHLSALYRGGLLLREKKGKEVYYLPDRKRIQDTLDRLGTYLRNCCP
ncbi:MAG: transcriptional regulator [Spirochaetaceae bacterium]|nr:transcriptional regulator [Spirochaetaceae bacterium]|tara:strand:- start:27464 stop:27775 length:312 start_codon:yes stop_codon:yes gene_type:complete